MQADYKCDKNGNIYLLGHGIVSPVPGFSETLAAGAGGSSSSGSSCWPPAGAGKAGPESHGGPGLEPSAVLGTASGCLVTRTQTGW